MMLTFANVLRGGEAKPLSAKSQHFSTDLPRSTARARPRRIRYASRVSGQAPEREPPITAARHSTTARRDPCRTRSVRPARRLFWARVGAPARRYFYQQLTLRPRLPGVTEQSIGNEGTDRVRAAGGGVGSARRGAGSDQSQ